MPYYEYRCKECEERFEEIHSICDRNIPVHLPCPSCGEDAVEHFIGAPLIVSSVGTNFKTDDGWKDRLREMKKSAGPRSTISV